MYYIGIDGGGAYARLVAVDEQQRVIGRHAGNSTNMRLNSHDLIFDNINKLITEFNILTNTKIEDCAAVCIGSAGVDSTQSALEMEKLLKKVGFANKVMAVNDAEIVLATETKGGAGVAVIAGTGAIGYAVDKDGKSSRAGGWGYLIDDAGSGYWIGMQAIKRALEEFDGRGDRTVLTEKIKAHFGVKQINAVCEHIYSDLFSKQKIAEIAILVKYAAAEKDVAALLIEEQAANELYRLAKVLIEKNGLFEHKVVIGGSVILLNENISGKLTQKIKSSFKNVEVLPVKEKPEMGAVFLAMAD